MTDLDARSPTHFWRARRKSKGAPAPRAAGLAIALALLPGCGKRVNDEPPPPLADVCGGGMHISSELQNPEPPGSDAGLTFGFNGPANGWVQPANVNSIGCVYPANQTMYATCLVVTAIDTWDETGDGAVGSVYVQDNVTPIPKYAGSSIFNPSFSPPSLRPLPGDIIDVTGIFEEYPGPTSGIFQQCVTLPQIEGAATFRYDGVVPAPVVIQPVDLSTYEGARQYLGMLVTVENVVISAAPKESSGRYSAAVVVPAGTGTSNWSIDNELFDIPTQYPLSIGESFTSVTGIVTYFYSVQLAPRGVYDFHGGPPPPTDGGTPPADAGTPPADGGADGG